MEALTLVAKASSRHSLYKGVTLYKPTNKWRAQISHGGRTVTLGDYNTEEEAARVFDRACICKYGKDAVCNFPVEDYKEEWDDLLSTTIPALLVKFKEERQRNKVSRGSSIGRNATFSGSSALLAAAESAVHPLQAALSRPRQAPASKTTAGRQLQGQSSSQTQPVSPSKTMAAVAAMSYGGMYTAEADCVGSRAAAKAVSQDPAGQLSERDRARGDEAPGTERALSQYVRMDSQQFRSRGALAAAVGTTLYSQGPAAGVAVASRRDHRHPAFSGPHRLGTNLDERKLDACEPGSAGSSDLAIAVANAPATSTPTVVRRRAAATRPGGAVSDAVEGVAASGVPPLVVLARTSSSPTLEDTSPALWRGRSIPNPTAAPEWPIPEAAAAAAPDEIPVWDDATVAACRDNLAAASRRVLPLQPPSRGHAGRYRASWNRSAGEHSGGAAMDYSTYKMEAPVRAMSDRPEVHGSSPVASRRGSVKRPAQEARMAAEAVEDVEEVGGYGVAPLAGPGISGRDEHGNKSQDLEFEPSYVAIPRGGFRRTPLTDWPQMKRMRSLQAPMHPAEDSTGAPAAAAEEEDRSRQASKTEGSSGGTEDSPNLARRWHGPVNSTAWYAAAAAGNGSTTVLPRSAVWGPAWSQYFDHDPYGLGAVRGSPAARQSGTAGASSFGFMPAAAAAALAAAENKSVEELQEVLLSALQRREQQLMKQQLMQEHQQLRWQQQEALMRLVAAAGLRPRLTAETLTLLDELSCTAGDDRRAGWYGSGGTGAPSSAVAAAIRSRKRAAPDNVGADDKLYDMNTPVVPALASRSLTATPAAQQQQHSQLLSAPQQQHLKSSGGGAVMPPDSLPSVVKSPDSPTSSSSGGGGGTRDVRFLTDTPTTAPVMSAPQMAPAATSTTPANRSHHLSPTVHRRPHTEVELQEVIDCTTTEGCSGGTSRGSSDRGDANQLGLEEKPAKDVVPVIGTTISGEAAGSSVARISQKWRLPGPPQQYERDRERTPTVRVSFGHDAQYGNYASGSAGGGSEEGASIEVPLLLRVPTSMQQQILGMLQLQIAESSSSLQSPTQSMRAQSLGVHEEIRAGVAKARRIELVSEEQ